MRQKEYKPLPEKHLWQLALHTGQWCRAVLCQAHRFFDALEADNRPLPWDDSESFDMFLADKTFLITAIHHSIVNMEKLNAELINRGDTSFQGVLDSIATAEERKQIRIWRNMNEHDLDYLSNNGNYQKEFIKTLFPLWLFNIAFLKTIYIMQSQMPSGHLLLSCVKMAATAKISSFAYLR